MPLIKGVGRSQAFVDGVFEQVDRTLEAASTPSSDADDSVDPIDVTNILAAKRITTVAVDRGMKLFVVRIDGIEPMSQSDFDSIANTPQIAAWFNQALMGGQETNPLSMESLSKRVGFAPPVMKKMGPPKTPHPRTARRRRQTTRTNLPRVNPTPIRSFKEQILPRRRTMLRQSYTHSN